MTRVQDDPKHRYYGPVRRLWVVFQTLFADNYRELDERYLGSWGEPWDDTLTRWIVANLGGPEQTPLLMRVITDRMIKISS